MTAITIDTTYDDARSARYRAAEQAVWRHYGLEARAEHLVHVGSPPARVPVVEVGSGPPLLVAHGTFGNGPAFAPLVRAARSAVADRRSTRWGFSSPVAYAAESFGQTIADLQRDVLGALGVNEADVVGHSIGGLFALRLAQVHPARVRRVVLVGAGPWWPRLTAPGDPPDRFAGWPRHVPAAPATTPDEAMIRGSGHGPSLDDGRIPEVSGRVADGGQSRHRRDAP